MFALSGEVKAKITELLPGFHEWIDTDEAKESIKERENREQQLRTLLDVTKIDKLSELDYRQIISLLWAYGGWTNKDYLADSMLKRTDFSSLKSELRNLLYGNASLKARYDGFFERVKGIGPAGITEILAFADSEHYGIWNDKSRKGLEMLGLAKELPTNKYKINGSDYEKVINALRSIFEIVKPIEGKPDLLLVDLFLYYVFKSGKIQIPSEKEGYEFDHDEIVDKLVQLGDGLGFETDSKKWIAKGAEVDVLWQAKIANLGVLNYVFEVQKSGSIDGLILNLQKAKNNPTVQKLVVVANKENIQKVKEEVESLPDLSFIKSLTFLEVTDVEKASSLLTEFNQIMNKLELVRPF